MIVTVVLCGHENVGKLSHPTAHGKTLHASTSQGRSPHSTSSGRSAPSAWSSSALRTQDPARLAQAVYLPPVLRGLELNGPRRTHTPEALPTRQTSRTDRVRPILPQPRELAGRSSDEAVFPQNGVPDVRARALRCLAFGPLAPRLPSPADLTEVKQHAHVPGLHPRHDRLIDGDAGALPSMAPLLTHACC